MFFFKLKAHGLDEEQMSIEELDLLKKNCYISLSLLFGVFTDFRLTIRHMTMYF